MTPEFSRRFALDSIGSIARNVSIEATAEERAAVAMRFDLVSLDALTATATLIASVAGVETKGRFVADVVQGCVVTGDPVATHLDEDFTLRFVDPEMLVGDTDEIELSDDDCDLIEMDSGGVDLGEAVTQTLGLALDPFPRSEAERAREDERKWVAGQDAGPFAGLKGMLKP
jgi:uncharacterized metal-binding protein YceD (DUF177 family)